MCSVIFVLSKYDRKWSLFLLFPPSGMRLIGEDKNTLALQERAASALHIAHLLALFLAPAHLSLSLCLPLFFNSGLREIFHSSFDRCQIDSMSSFRLNCLGETKFVRENSNLDDKCQDTPDGMTGEALIRLPAHVPGGLSVSLSLSHSYSYLFMVDPNRNLEIQMKFFF